MHRASAFLLATCSVATLSGLGLSLPSYAQTTDVPGAETAPVAPTEGEQPKGSVTMTGPETDAGVEDAPCAEDDADCTVETGDDGDVPGAETAPVPPMEGEQPQGSVTMTGPEEEDADASGGAPAGDLNIAVAYEEDGRYFTDEGIPTYNVMEDGTVDWLSFSGFRRYHSECHVCHGPDGEGSSYAPALKESANTLSYDDFVNAVVGGIKKVGASDNSVMPSFGNNLNVMCYLDDIYVYLKARGNDAVERGRPALKEAKSDAIREEEDACMG